MPGYKATNSRLNLLFGGDAYSDMKLKSPLSLMSGKVVNATSGATEEFPEMLPEIINEGTYIHE